MNPAKPRLAASIAKPQAAVSALALTQARAICALLTHWRQRLADHQALRRQRAEMQAMGARDLQDLGIGRGEVALMLQQGRR